MGRPALLFGMVPSPHPGLRSNCSVNRSETNTETGTARRRAFSCAVAAGLCLAALIPFSTGCARHSPGDAERPDRGRTRTGVKHRVFTVRGVVQSVKPERRSATIEHEEIPGYMEAMTMPFRVRRAEELRGVAAGDRIRFQFHVGADESWMEKVEVLQRGAAVQPRSSNATAQATALTGSSNAPLAGTNVLRRPHPLMDFKFTNELGQPVSLRDFRGRALGITFIFTRCPVPDYCPRLTKNFQETALKLKQLPNAPTNWHLLSFTIDPAFDTPKILKGYAQRYQYDPNHWSFLTGPSEQITELVRESGVTVEPDAGLFSHNFRTLIIAPNGQLQTSIPIGGPISDGIVAELLKAMGTTNAVN
jgi:protein SCO1/2